MLGALRRRLTAYHLTVLAVVVTLYALGSYAVTHRLLLAAIDDASHRLLQPAAAGFASSSESFEELSHEFDEFTLEPGEHAAVLYADGRVRAWRGEGPAPARIDPRPGARTEGGLRALVVPLPRGGHTQGALYIARSLAEERRALASLAAALLGMLPLSLLAAGLAGSWLAGRASAPVEAAIARERQFTRDVSHELRTPLAMLGLQVDLAREVPDATPALAARLAAVGEATHRLGELVDDLLALTRGEAGPSERPLGFSLAEVVEEEAAAITPLAEARGIALELALADGPARAVGDPPAVARAVRNLLDNAIRYAPAGSRVGVRLARRDGAHVIAVTSAGPPIAEADRARIFERFGRADAGQAANPGGTGLGLAIARAVARAHGGTLVLAPAGGAGNTFELCLPEADGADWRRPARSPLPDSFTIER